MRALRVVFFLFFSQGECRGRGLRLRRGGRENIDVRVEEEGGVMFYVEVSF